LGATGVKAAPKYVGEIGPWCQFLQHSVNSYCASRFKLISLAHGKERKA